MKKTLIFICTIVFCSHNLFAQDTIHLKHTVNKVLVTDRAPQAVFGEVFGRSIVFSANYDRRVFNRVDGLGYTIGLGYISVGDDGNSNVGLFSIPITINYLLGNNGKYLEIGAGATYFDANVTGSGDVSEGSSTIIGTMTIGYRSQPINNGFMFRAGINPFFFKNNFIPYYPYISFGYSF
jgi:hypothetical protein